RDQEEDQLTGIHVSVQSHAVRQRLRQVLDEVEAQVRNTEQQRADPGQRICTELYLAERRADELVQPAADTLDLDAVGQHEDQHANRHAKRGIQVRGWERPKVIDSDSSS